MVMLHVPVNSCVWKTLWKTHLHTFAQTLMHCLVNTLCAAWGPNRTAEDISLTSDMIHAKQAWADGISLTCRNVHHGLSNMQRVHETRCACSQVAHHQPVSQSSSVRVHCWLWHNQKHE